MELKIPLKSFTWAFMSAIVSLSAYMVRQWLLYCPVSSDYEWKLAAQPSSEYCWRGTAAFWHGIVQCFVFEISPFVTAGHVGGQSTAAFRADKSNSCLLGMFEILFFPRPLDLRGWLWFPLLQMAMFLTLWIRYHFNPFTGLLKWVSLFFFFPYFLPSAVFCSVVIWPYHLLGSKDDVWAWK